jgi:hypothetical protein
MANKNYLRGIKEGYRSGLEGRIAQQLKDLGIDGQYEQHKIKFEQPAKLRTYTPDFKIGSIFIETKGRFTTADRMKHLYIKKSNPELDIRFVFSNSRQKLSKNSKTTYAAWCDKHGFKYADKLISEEWINETNR